MLRAALVVAAWGALAGCAGSSPPPVSALDASRANVQLAELQSGRTLLMRKCGGCHRVPMPSDHTAHDWPAKLVEMSDRAKVDDQQRHLIEAYLVTMTQRR
jgi:hypothetical protein